MKINIKAAKERYTFLSWTCMLRSAAMMCMPNEAVANFCIYHCPVKEKCRQVDEAFLDLLKAIKQLPDEIEVPDES